MWPPFRLSTEFRDIELRRSTATADLCVTQGWQCLLQNLKVCRTTKMQKEGPTRPVKIGLQQCGNCHESLPFSPLVGWWTTKWLVAGSIHGFSGHDRCIWFRSLYSPSRTAPHWRAVEDSSTALTSSERCLDRLSGDRLGLMGG